MVAVKAIENPQTKNVVGVMENTLVLVLDLAEELETLNVSTTTGRQRLDRLELELKQAEALLQAELATIEPYLKPTSKTPSNASGGLL